MILRDVFPVEGSCMARSTSNGLVCGVEAPAGQDSSATRAMRPARPYPHVAGSRSVLILQEQTGESFPGCSHPANTANAETRQALGASFGWGVPCLSWACASCTPQEGWKEPPSPVSPRQPAGEWNPRIQVGQCSQYLVLGCCGKLIIFRSKWDGLGLPLPSLTHTALSGHLPQGEPILA